MLPKCFHLSEKDGLIARRNSAKACDPGLKELCLRSALFGESHFPKTNQSVGVSRPSGFVPHSRTASKTFEYRNVSHPKGRRRVKCSASSFSLGSFRSLASLLDFPMGESVDVSALRAGPATGFRIRALGMRHFICDAALHAASRLATHEFLFLHGPHRILSIESVPS